MKAVIEINIDLEGVTAREVTYILMDALFEFQTHRGPTAEAYINGRYPDTPDYAWLDRKEKAKQVDRRKLIAETMRNNISIED